MLPITRCGYLARTHALRLPPYPPPTVMVRLIVHFFSSVFIIHSIKRPASATAYLEVRNYRWSDVVVS